MLDLVFPCFSVNFQVFGDPKLAMDVENLDKWEFIASWRLKEQKFEQENQFQHPPSLKFLIFFLFSSLLSLILN